MKLDSKKYPTLAKITASEGGGSYKVPVGDNTQVRIIVDAKDRADAQDAAVGVVEEISQWGKDLTVGVPKASSGGYKVPILENDKPAYHFFVTAKGRAEAQDLAAAFIEELREWGSNLAVGVPIGYI